MKQPKQCPHTNIVQAESNGVISTFCVDCKEVVKTETAYRKVNDADLLIRDIRHSLKKKPNTK